MRRHNYVPIDSIELKPGASFGARLWYAMHKRGLSVDELAKKALTNRETVGRWIHDKYNPRGIDSLTLLADALGVSVDWLCCRTESMKGVLEDAQTDE